MSPPWQLGHRRLAVFLICPLVSHGITDDCDPRAPEIAKGARDWLLLLQIDSDEHAGMRWGNAGMLYYWVKRDDLHAQHFDALALYRPERSEGSFRHLMNMTVDALALCHPERSEGSFRHLMLVFHHEIDHPSCHPEPSLSHRAWLKRTFLLTAGHHCHSSEIT